MTNLDSILNSRDITLPTKVRLVKAMVFPVVMWELDYKESWVLSELKNWCFWTVVLEKTLESPLDCKEVQLVHPKGNQSWIFIGRTEAETPILWPPDVKSWLIWKDSDAEKNWRQEDRGTRGLDGLMSSLTQCTWVWANSGRWWWTGKPGVLQSMGSQRVTKRKSPEWLNWPLQSNSYHFDLTFLHLQSPRYVFYYYFVRPILFFYQHWKHRHHPFY